MRRRTWEWRDSLADWGREMNRIFGHFAPVTVNPTGPAVVYPPINLWQDNDALYVEAELPGLKQEDLNLTVQHGVLTLAGERHSPLGEDSVYQRRERGMGTFSRTVELPAEVDATRVEAELKHGVLTVKLPKAEAAKPRKIPIQVA